MNALYKVAQRIEKLNDLKITEELKLHIYIKYIIIWSL